MLPNLIYSTSLAHYLSWGEQETTIKQLEDQISVLHSIERPSDLEKLSADGFLIMAILLYPSIISSLSKKNSYDKVGNLSKSYFIKE